MLQGRVINPKWQRYVANEDVITRAGGGLLPTEDVVGVDAIFDERPWPDVPAEAALV
jgi:hypothetical protein